MMSGFLQLKAFINLAWAPYLEAANFSKMDPNFWHLSEIPRERLSRAHAVTFNSLCLWRAGPLTIHF